MSEMNDDEIIARALQEEYNREANRQQQQQQRRSSRPTARIVLPSAPPEDAIRGRRAAESDEDFARRIAQEEERLYRFHQQRQARHANVEQPSAEPSRNHRASSSHSRPAVDTTAAAYDVKRTDSNDTPVTSPDGSSILEFEDEEYARRVEQELNDEEVARQMQASDERRASQNAARQIAMAPRPRYTFGCFCGYLLFFTFVGAAVVYVGNGRKGLVAKQRSYHNLYVFFTTQCVLLFLLHTRQWESS